LIIKDKDKVLNYIRWFYKQQMDNVKAISIKMGY
jgi:hypothetical protein